MLRIFQPIIPTIYPDDQLPGLPEYPWHLVNRERVNKELALLQAEGLFTSIVLWNATPEPPLEICFMTARMGADRVLIIITPWNYPAQPPSARVAPFAQMDTDGDLYGDFRGLMGRFGASQGPARLEMVGLAFAGRLYSGTGTVAGDRKARRQNTGGEEVTDI